MENFDICFQCEQEDVILESGVCEHCDYLNRKNDYLQNDGTVIITKTNIHLYYEFMSDEELSKLSFEIRSYLDDIMYSRFKKIRTIMFPKYKSCQGLNESINNKLLRDSIAKNLTTHFSGNLCFKVIDTLKPIDEYIAEIKASNEYKKYIATKNA